MHAGPDTAIHLEDETRRETYRHGSVLLLDGLARQPGSQDISGLIITERCAVSEFLSFVRIYWQRAGEHESPQADPFTHYQASWRMADFRVMVGSKQHPAMESRPGPQKGQPPSLSLIRYTDIKCAERYQCSVPDRTCLSVAGTFCKTSWVW